MKIRMTFGVVKSVIIAIVFVGVLAVEALDIALLAGAGALIASSPAIPIVSMIAAGIIGIACLLLLFNSYYKFKENSFIIMLGFFADKVRYEDVVVLRQNIATNELYMIVTENNPAKAQIGLKVNIAAGKTDSFITCIREHIPNVTVEIFSEPKKKKKDK